jgi:hypothetical protein
VVGVLGKTGLFASWKFRTNAYGWRASSLAIGRLKEAVAEIRSVAKSDPVAAGDGVVSLMERIWPSFQGIDTSSGALGAAVLRTVNEPIPILTVAPADHATRGKWLERLFEAVQNDGVEYITCGSTEFSIRSSEIASRLKSPERDPHGGSDRHHRENQPGKRRARRRRLSLRRPDNQGPEGTTA